MRTRGLCFNCDEWFTPEHKCQGPKILLLGAENDDNNQDEQDCDHEVLGEGPEISLHALTGWTVSQTKNQGIGAGCFN